jgi:hypothetical protein
MVRIALCLALASACTHAQSPRVRHAGEALSLAGVAGLILTSITTRYSKSYTGEMLFGFSVMSGAGIMTYALAELSGPSGGSSESLPARNHRWARILTERALGAARSSQCPRVRHLEMRVRVYDLTIHDLVFMRDPEILKCMSEVPAPDPETAPAEPQTPDSPKSDPDPDL